MKLTCVFTIFLLLFCPLLELQAGPICHTGTSTHRATNTGYSSNYYSANHYEYVPVVQKVATVPDFFYSSRDYLRDEAILEAIKALREAKAGVVQNQNNTGTASAVSPEVDTFLRGLPLPDDAPTAGRGHRGTAMEQLVDNSCLSCHNSGKKMGQLDLSNLAKLSFDDMLKVQTAVVSGTMPPKGRLPAAQVKVTNDWLRDYVKK